MGLVPTGSPSFLLGLLPRQFSKLEAGFSGKRAVVRVVDCTNTPLSGLQSYTCQFSLTLSKPFLPLKFSQSRMEAEVGVLRPAEDPALGALCS